MTLNSYQVCLVLIGGRVRGLRDSAKERPK